jgi:hypothetical protein
MNFDLVTSIVTSVLLFLTFLWLLFRRLSRATAQPSGPSARFLTDDPRTQQGLLCRLIGNLNLHRRNWETDTTFRLLIAVIVSFGAVLTLWAIGAGVMRAVWLYDAGKNTKWFNADAPLVVTSAWSDAIFVLMQIVRAVGGVLALALGGGLVGALLGFLFGHPQAPEKDKSATEKDQRSQWRLNTSLAQVLDWLTKGIVSVGLVTAQSSFRAFSSFAATAAGWLFESRHGSPPVIMAAIAGGAVLGFIFAYLYSVLFVARLIAQADAGLDLPEAAKTMVRNIRVGKQKIAPRISRSRSARGRETTNTPSLAEIEAALKFSGISFDDLIENKATRDDIPNWSRAKAVLDDYSEAAKGYVHLVGMKGPDGEIIVETDPALLLEAARVLNQAGPHYQTAAAALIQAALKVLDKASPEIADPIIGDASALYLSGRLPGGYQKALDLLRDIDDKNKHPDADGRLHLLRAFAMGQQYNDFSDRKSKTTDRQAQEKLEKELDELVKKINDDLNVAFKRSDGNLWQENQCAWRADPAEGCIPDEDDLRLVYKERSSFKDWIDNWPKRRNGGLPPNGAEPAPSSPSSSPTPGGPSSPASSPPASSSPPSGPASP